MDGLQACVNGYMDASRVHGRWRHNQKRLDPSWTHLHADTTETNIFRYLPLEFLCMLTLICFGGMSAWLLIVLPMFHSVLVSGTKKEHKPKLLSPDLFRWGRGLPHEGVGAKKFCMPLETREIKLFCRDIPGFCRDIPEAPEKLRKKGLCSILVPYQCWNCRNPHCFCSEILFLYVEIETYRRDTGQMPPGTPG